jgi:hypothetical protein
MVRVFKEDIQKRKEESDRKSGKGGSGTLELSAPELFLLFYCCCVGTRVLDLFIASVVVSRIWNAVSAYSIHMKQIFNHHVPR